MINQSWEYKQLTGLDKYDLWATCEYKGEEENIAFYPCFKGGDKQVTCMICDKVLEYSNYNLHNKNLTNHLNCEKHQSHKQVKDIIELLDLIDNEEEKVVNQAIKELPKTSIEKP